jgi:hypothetical protein
VSRGIFLPSPPQGTHQKARPAGANMPSLVPNTARDAERGVMDAGLVRLWASYWAVVEPGWQVPTCR